MWLVKEFNGWKGPLEVEIEIHHTAPHCSGHQPHGHRYFRVVSVAEKMWLWMALVLEMALVQFGGSAKPSVVYGDDPGKVRLLQTLYKADKMCTHRVHVIRHVTSLVLTVVRSLW